MAANCCPNGFTYNPTTGECERVSSTIAPSTNNFFPALKGVCQGFGHIGAYFYNDVTALPKPIQTSNVSVNFPTPIGFSDPAAIMDGASTPVAPQNFVATTPLNMTWGFPFPPPSPVPVICQTGRLNTSGIFGASAPFGTNTYTGIRFCVTIPATKTYYIGLAADDVIRITIDNQLIFDLGSTPFPSYNSTVWRIFPITLTAGQHNILLEQYNINGPGGTVTTGMEIYDAPSLAALVSVPNSTALAPYVLFTSSSLIGQPYNNGWRTPGTGLAPEEMKYTCGNGCFVNVCNTPATCDCVETQTAGACCFQLTDCTSGVAILTQTDLSIYLDKIIKIEGSQGCYIVSYAQDFSCTGGVPVVFTEEFTTCEECTKKCYKLIDCSGINDDVITDTDLLAYVGKVIKIESCPDVCWTVVAADDCTGATPIVLTESFDSCNSCFGIFKPTINLKTRSVYPNYGNTVNGCSIEYIEKVNCNFAEQAYSRMIKKRYGLKSGEEDQYDKWWIKKKLLDFTLIQDPYACTPPPVETPCAELPAVVPPIPLTCPAPSSVTVEFSYTENCDPVSSVEVSFTFNNPVGNP